MQKLKYIITDLGKYSNCKFRIVLVFSVPKFFFPPLKQNRKFTELMNHRFKSAFLLTEPLTGTPFK